MNKTSRPASRTGTKDNTAAGLTTKKDSGREGCCRHKDIKSGYMYYQNFTTVLLWRTYLT